MPDTDPHAAGPAPSAPGRAVRVAALALLVVLGTVTWAVARWQQDPVPRDEVRVGRSTAELTGNLPFHELLYKRTPAHLRIAEAQRRFVIACMAERGFRYEPPPIDTSPSTEGYPAPFGLESLTPPELAPGSPPRVQENRGEAFGRALLGDPGKRIRAHSGSITVTRPANGCQAESEQRLLGPDRTHWLQLRVQLGEGEKEIRRELETDPVFRTANARWRGCMAKRGFTASKDPVALLFRLPRGTDLSRTPVAVADIRCKSETGYLLSAYTRLGALQRAWLDEHADTLRDWNALQKAQDEIARASQP
ncbi:hypothetical protein [Streptomyces griseoluteus]